MMLISVGGKRYLIVKTVPFSENLQAYDG